MRFSERMGIIKVSKIIQKEEVSNELRAILWNVIYKNVVCNADKRCENELKMDFAIHFVQILVDAPGYAIFNVIRNLITKGAWFEVYDTVEYVCFFVKKTEKTLFRNALFILSTLNNDINSALEQENSAYRLVGDEIVPIIDDTEIKEIETAQENPRSNVQTHINTALGFLSDRQNPDYRNSIKESISAVEALCREITGENTLDKALPALEKKGIFIPKMLRKSFENVYHFTNGESGIRHALMDEEEEPGFEEAKYMLVVCSAFVNYIQGKKAKA